MQDFHSSVFLR